MMAVMMGEMCLDKAEHEDLRTLCDWYGICRSN